MECPERGWTNDWEVGPSRAQSAKKKNSRPRAPSLSLTTHQVATGKGALSWLELETGMGEVSEIEAFSLFVGLLFVVSGGEGGSGSSSGGGNRRA